jgi:hypothetical protein
MRRYDMTAKRNCAVRGGAAFVAGAMVQVAMLRNPGAIVRALYASD